MRGSRTVTWVLGAYKGLGKWEGGAYCTLEGSLACSVDVRMGNVVVCIERRVGEKLVAPWEPLRKSARMGAH